MQPKTLFEYYKNNNQQLPALSDRASLYEKAGFGSAATYTGSAFQNTQLLGHLTSNKNTSDTPNPVKAQPQSAAVTSKTVGGAVDPVTGLPLSSGAAGNQTATKSPQDVATYRATVEPAGGKPAAPNYSDNYAKLRADQGISTIEDNINHLAAEKDALQGQLSTFRAKEAIGATSSGVFNARMSEEERNIQERVDAIDRSLNIAQNNLTTKNNFIDSVMKWTQADYATAKDNYESTLSTNMQMQDRVDTQADKIQASARANLSTINTLIANSGKTYDALSPALKAQVNSLELQAGFPIGTFETFARAKPKANVLASTISYDDKGNQSVTIVNQDPDTNAISVTQVPTGGVKGYATLSNQEKNAAFTKAKGYFDQTKDQKTGFVSAADYLDVRGQYPGQPKDFDANMAVYLSPEDRKKLGVGRTGGGISIDLSGAIDKIRAQNGTAAAQ